MKEHVFFYVLLHACRAFIVKYSNVSYVHAQTMLLFSCRDNCARKTSLSGFKILGTVCSDNCRTKFGGLSYVWRMYRRNSDTNDRQKRDANEWEEYTDLDELSVTGMLS